MNPRLELALVNGGVPGAVNDSESGSPSFGDVMRHKRAVIVAALGIGDDADLFFVFLHGVLS